MKNFFSKIPPEAAIIVCSFLLSLCGILTIGSSQTAAVSSLHFVLRQSGFLILSIGILLAAYRIKFSFWQKVSPLTAGFIWLGLLFLIFFGTPINSMTGWFKIGPFTLQPSEFGRIFYLLILAKLLSSDRQEKKRFIIAVLFTGFWLLPIAGQPDFGMVFVHGITFIVVSYLAGISLKYLAVLPVFACLTLGGVLLKYPYVVRRFTGFLFPELDPQGSGWHVRQFTFAIARGGWSGSKMGGAMWSNAYLPFSYNDSAGAALLETIGWGGAAIPSVLFSAWILACSKLADQKGCSNQARLVIAGTAVFTAVQMLTQMAINLTLIPPSGLVLPFISYGGSALTSLFLMTGITLSASKENKDFSTIITK
ncbi:MAG: FtsW/RodA/SpoVE family cell cycle protein [Lentisphaeria bacterium]|nr:FtsW/RodA/SpoVE family cell cycle protein [Lentisphaeria bacterium]